MNKQYEPGSDLTHCIKNVFRNLTS